MSTRLAGLLGVLTPIFTLTLIFVSIALLPWFDWHNNALSDMGVSRTPNPFNAVPEILAAVVIGAWTLSFGAKLLFESRQAMEDRAEA